MEISYLVTEDGSTVIKCRRNATMEALAHHHDVDLKTVLVGLRADHCFVEHDGEYYYRAGETEWVEYSDDDFRLQRIPELRDYSTPVIDLTSIERVRSEATAYW